MSEIIAAPTLCGYTEIEVAHAQMQRHRQCRINSCVWKSAAFQTLVLTGCLVPQSLPPRERAAARGIAFPALNSEPVAGDAPTSESLRRVLDKLSELAHPPLGIER
jgi:hypothetical protein